MSGKAPKSVRVFLRIRPPVRQELERKDGLDCVVAKPDDLTVCVLKSTRGDKDGEEVVREHRFHHCFDQDAPQDEVYERVARDTVEDVFAGYHGLIFVYGQTGTGKTYTLCCHDAGREGILYNAVVDVFARIQRDADHEYECALQFVQIYNEVIQDLLAPGGRSPVVQLRDDPEADGAVYLAGSSSIPVTTAGECLKWYLQGDKRRATGETLMNDSSSRSHTVFMLDVLKRRRLRKEDVDAAGGGGSVTQGRLILVDLAGCEKIKKTASEGLRLTEANSINGSLLVLGRVVNALTDSKPIHVPYRESKLTRLLQYPLSGMGKTSIIVTVSPSSYNYDETSAAVLFGQRAMKLKVTAKVHEKVDWKALALKLQAMLEAGLDGVRAQALGEQQLDYEKQLQAARERAECLELQLATLEPRNVHELSEENHALRELVRALQTKVIKLDDRRKADKKDRKALQQALDTETEERLRAQVAQKEAEHALRAMENRLLEAQNESLALTTDQRRPSPTPDGGGGGNMAAEVPAPPPPANGTLHSNGHADGDGEGEESWHEGTLELSGADGHAVPRENSIRVDFEAYGDTAEQLSQALGEVRSLKQERQRLQNELRISALAHRKLLCRVETLEGQAKTWSDLAKELEEKVHARDLELLSTEERIRLAKTETEEQERLRYQRLVSRVSEYEARMDRYRSQMQRATNEARIEANAKGKLQSKVSQLLEEKAQTVEQARTLETQILELTGRLATRQPIDSAPSL